MPLTRITHSFRNAFDCLSVSSPLSGAKTTWVFNLKEVHEKAQGVVDAAVALPIDSSRKAGLTLHAEKLCILFDDYLFRSSFCRRLRDEFQGADDFFRMKEGAVLAAPKAGLNEYAYLSEVDYSAQPYII